MPIPKHTIAEIKKVYNEGMPVDIISIKYYITPQRVMEVVSGRYEANRKPRKRTFNFKD